MSLFGFGPKETPEQMHRRWMRELKRKAKSIDRDVIKLQNAEKQALQKVKASVKSKHHDAARVVAKEVGNTRKAIKRLLVAKSHTESAQLTLDLSMKGLKVQNVMQQSTEVFQLMNDLVKIPELRADMVQMSREMEKAGLWQEQMDDNFELLDEDVMEADDESIDKIMEEVTTSLLAQNTTKSTPTTIPQTAAQTAGQQKQKDKEFSNVEERLKALGVS